MSVARTLLLKVSDNQWLRENGTKAPFIRRAVSRFMPGESFDDMMVAAARHGGRGHRARCSRGSARTSRTWPRPTAWPRHYLEGIDRIARAEPRLRAVDQADAARTRHRPRAGLRRTCATWPRARTRPATTCGSTWSSRHYVDVTLDADAAAARGVSARRRVPAGVPVTHARRPRWTLSARGIGVRLVKGAYNEPADVAFPKKSDVDANYFALAQLMLARRLARRRIARRCLAPTTAADPAIRRHAAATGVKPAEFEFHMLYGIQKAAQLRLAAGGRARCAC